MFIIKTKRKIIIAILGAILIIVGIVLSIFIFKKAHEQENPSFDEMCKLYIDNKESFNIANNYLRKQSPNERGLVIYDINTVEKNKANMTDEEYKAMKVIFSNQLIIKYRRDVDDDIRYGSWGKFVLKSNDKYGSTNICYIPYGEISSACGHIADNWYVYYSHPVDLPLEN